MRTLLIAAVALMVSASVPALAEVGDIGTVGGNTYIVISVTPIGGGDYVVTYASDSGGVQTVLMEIS
jgi:hypothetical protein